MAAYNIIDGRDDGTFGGSASITRAQFATLVVKFANLGAGVDLPVVAHPFTDVAADNVHGPNIARLFGANIIRGKSDTTFAPSASISRAEAATVLKQAHEALGVDFSGFTPVNFTDVSGTHAENIGLLAAADVINGTSATTFAPNRNVSRAETASLLKNSADVLSALNLWTADPLPAAPGTTNQTFTVTEADELIVSTANGTTDPQRTRSFSVDVGDAETVSILLVDAGDDGVATSALPAIAIDGGTVTFEQDGTEGEADLSTATLITRVTTGEGDNQVTVSTTAAATAEGISVVDGVVEFNLLAVEGEDFAVVPVVVAGDRNDLPVNAAGEPTIDFGVGGATFFIDPADVALTAALTGDVDGDAFNADAPFGGTVTATFTLFAGTNAFIVPSAGEELTAFAVRGAEGEGAPAPAFAPFDDPAVLTIAAGSALIVDGATLTIGDDNSVSFTWDGPDKPGVSPTGEEIVDELFIAWEASGALAAADVTLENVQVEWNDDAAVVAAAGLTYTIAGVEVEDTDDLQRIVGTDVPLVVTVVDQFGQPVADEAVEIVYDGINIDRTTNASGQATANLASPSDTGETPVTITVNEIAAAVDIQWYEVYDPEADGAGEIDGAALLSINTAGGYVVVETATNTYAGVVYTGSNFFETEDGFVSQAAWVEDVLKRLEDETDSEISTTGFTDDAVDNQINVSA